MKKQLCSILVLTYRAKSGAPGHDLPGKVRRSRSRRAGAEVRA